MILISNLGNLNGPNKNENNPNYIQNALDLGYDCKIDIFYNNQLYLNTYEIDITFLFINHKKLWINCINIDALIFLFNFDCLNLFCQREDFTLTSKKFIWSYLKINNNNCVTVVNNTYDIPLFGYGICSDNIHKLESLNCKK